MTVIFTVEEASQRSLVAVSVLGLALTTTAVSLRLLARKIANRGFDASDYCVVAGCVGILVREILLISALTEKT